MPCKNIVLLIDDSMVNLAMLKKVLQKHGFHVLLANNGERGLTLARQYIPDIILLDVVMAGWDGYETCQQLKQQPELTQIPVLFLSALEDTKNKVRAFQAGAVDYVSKPFQEQELLARVQTHVELSHLRKNLESEVAHKTEKIRSLLDSLQNSYQKEQHLSELKSQFLRNISHEFRTPMNIIMGMTDILIEDTQLDEEQMHCSQSIKNAANQLFTILTDMLNFSQQFSSELKQEICEFQLNELVEEIVDKQMQKAQAKSLVLMTDIGVTLPHTLKGNKQAIVETLMKLVDNAIRFTEQGYVMLTIQPAGLKDNKYWLRFEVKDTGIGISEEKQVSLFEIFSQVDGSSTRENDGMGMGLAVAKVFVENMGGQIGIHSVLNEGSTFWFHIPIELTDDEVVFDSVVA